MRLLTYSRGISHTSTLTRWVQSRFHQALRHGKRRLEAVTVRLEDVNGARGGVDTRCQVTMQFASGAPVVVSAMGRDVHSAVEAAATRSKQTLLGKIRRAWNERRARSRKVKPYQH